MKNNQPPAPRERLRLDLEDVRSWLMEHIDGGEEVKGYDSVLSGYINTIDAALAALPSETGTTPASPAATPMKHFSEKVRNKKESEYGPFTNADWNAACALEAENADLLVVISKCEQQRDEFERISNELRGQLAEAVEDIEQLGLDKRKFFEAKIELERKLAALSAPSATEATAEDWYKAASPYATPAALREALKSLPVEAEPMLQYYYKTTGCKAEHPKDPDCICWHDKGTGPLASGGFKPTSWRIKPDDSPDMKGGE